MRTIFIWLSLILLAIIGLFFVALALANLAGAEGVNLLETAIESAVIESNPDLPETLAGVLALLFTVPLRLAGFFLMLLIVLVVHRLNYQIAGWFLRTGNLVIKPSLDDVTISGRRPAQLRRANMQELVAGLISLGAYSLFILAVVGQFIDFSENGLFITVLANALGFGSRDFVSDILLGVTQAAEGEFDVGEKIEVVRPQDSVDGVVEKISIRAVNLRLHTGEQVVLPHGEMRVLRNFSRARYSGGQLVFKFKSNDLRLALMAVEKAIADPALREAGLLGNPRISADSTAGLGLARLVISYRASYGMAPELRLTLVRFIEKQLALAGLSGEQAQRD